MAQRPSFFGRYGRRIIAGCLTMVIGITCSGCWDITNPEQLRVPVLLAVSWHQGHYHVAIQSVVPKQMSTGTQGGSGGQEPMVVSQGAGSTLTAAILQTGLGWTDPNRFSHLQVLILQDSVLTPQALPGVWDSLLRNPFLAPTFWVFSTSQAITSLVQPPEVSGAYPTNALAQAIQSADRVGSTRSIRFVRLMERWFNAPQDAVLIPQLSVMQTPTPQAINASYQFPGVEVVVGTRRVGTLSATQVRILNLLDPPRDGLPPYAQLNVSLGPNQVGTVVMQDRPQIWWQSGTCTIQLDLTTLVSDVTGPLALKTPTPAMEQSMGKAIASQVTQQALTVLRWGQRHHADLLQVGRTVAARDPQWFHTHESSWPNIWAQSTVQVKTNVDIRSTGNFQ